MSIVQQMVTLVGGTTAAIAVIAWLTKSLLGQFLKKDVEQHKALLRAQTDAELEKLRAVLERESLEHEIKFRRIDDRVAEHLGEIYARLFRLYESASKYVAILEHSGEPSKEEKFDIVVEANREFWDYFLPNRLYVTPTLFKRIRAVADGLDKVVGIFARGRVREEQGRRLPDEDYWMNAYSTFEKDVTPLFTDLVLEFQRRLGISDLEVDHSEKATGGS